MQGKFVITMMMSVALSINVFSAFVFHRQDGSNIVEFHHLGSCWIQRHYVDGSGSFSSEFVWRPPPWQSKSARGVVGYNVLGARSKINLPAAKQEHQQ